MPVGLMLRAMSARELDEWAAYYAVEPWGEERADLRTGILAALQANLWRKSGTPAVKPADFMPDFLGREAEEQSPEDQMAMMRLAAQRMGEKEA